MTISSLGSSSYCSWTRLFLYAVPQLSTGRIASGNTQLDMAIRAWFDWCSIPLDGRPATRGIVAVECPNGLSAIARSESVDFVNCLKIQPPPIQHIQTCPRSSTRRNGTNELDQKSNRVALSQCLGMSGVTRRLAQALPPNWALRHETSVWTKKEDAKKSGRHCGLNGIVRHHTSACSRKKRPGSGSSINTLQSLLLLNKKNVPP